MISEVSTKSTPQNIPNRTTVVFLAGCAIFVLVLAYLSYKTFSIVDNIGSAPDRYAEASKDSDFIE